MLCIGLDYYIIVVKSLWKHIGKAGSGNNSFGRVGGKDAFLRRAVFHELEREWYDETGIILNGLLDAYAQAAKAWRGLSLCMRMKTRV